MRKLRAGSFRFGRATENKNVMQLLCATSSVRRRAVCNGTKTQFVWHTRHPQQNRKTERFISICSYVN